MATDPRGVELKMDPANLYREETFTDRKLGVIRVLTPVKVDGSTDTTRQVLYLGEAQLLTAMGAIPLTFEIEVGRYDLAAEQYAVGHDRAGDGHGYGDTRHTDRYANADAASSNGHAIDGSNDGLITLQSDDAAEVGRSI